MEPNKEPQPQSQPQPQPESEQPFANFTDAQLLKHVYYLDVKNRQLQTRVAQLEPYKQRQVKKPPINKQDALFSKFKMKRVALKIAYVGTKYSGFSLQDNDVESNTIEGYLFRCMYGLSLIPDKMPTEEYSRAGRTDKGVSAYGNVIALNLRSSEQLNPSITNNNNGSRSKDMRQGGLDYTKMLNSILPEDIKVLAYREVPDTFNARYQCIKRTYKYFFPKNHLDLETMKTALGYLVGTHNFTNFCKIDITETATFQRTIFQASLERVQDSDILQMESSDDRNQMYYFRFVGNSFLWHQIRFMVSVLFIVGAGREKPEIVMDLLDVQKTKSKPNYPAAPEWPLVLQNCQFKDLEFPLYKEHAVAFYNMFNQCIMKLVLEMTLLVNCVDMSRRWCVETDPAVFRRLSQEEGRRRWERQNGRLQIGKSTCSGVEETANRLTGKKQMLYEKKKMKQEYYESLKKQEQESEGEQNSVDSKNGNQACLDH